MLSDSFCQLSGKHSLFEQLICRQWENLNEIASQTGDAGHRKSNSRIEVTPKCRPAHPKERGVVLGNQKQADANKAAAATRDASVRPILEAMRGQPFARLRRR
jgi:hypothetical protein